MGKFKLLIGLLAVIMLSVPLMAENGTGTTDESVDTTVKAKPAEAQPTLNLNTAMQVKDNVMRVAGGVELLSESVIGNRIVTDFYQVASLFIFGNVKPKNWDISFIFIQLKIRILPVITTQVLQRQ